MLIGLLALIVGAWATCDLDNAPNDPFAVAAPDAEAVWVIVEVWPPSGAEPWAANLLDVLTERNLLGTLVLPLPREPLPTSLAQLIATQVERGHEPALGFDARNTPRDILSPMRNIKSGIRLARESAGRIRTAAALNITRHTEPALGRLGFRTILIGNGPSTAVPRRAKALEGQPLTGVVLHTGPYAGACGASPIAPTWTPAAADRATQALHGAAVTGGTVRVVLDGTVRSEDDARVLARWLDDIVLPSGATVTTPSRIRVAVNQSFRTNPLRRPEAAPLPLAGRLVPLDDVKAAAIALADQAAVPRSLPGDLLPTEAFAAFVKVLSDVVEDDSVRLGALNGPRAVSQTSLSSPITIPRDEVIALAQALGTEAPTDVPSALWLGGQLLTAAEVLVTFASAVRGDDPCTTRSTEVPEPNAPGLGWGNSGG